LFLPFYLVVFCFLVLIFVFDLKHLLILDRIIFPAIAVVAVWLVLAAFCFDLYSFNDLFGFVSSAFAAATVFLIIVLATRGKGMGVGDVKLVFFMGLVLGWPGIYLALLLSFFSGALIGIGLMLAKKKTMKSEVPFGPFLVFGTLAAVFWAEEIFAWYQNIFMI
jgi:prepilin signal peptidase PulO-like enzyme (type II secretory pathway)